IPHLTVAQSPDAPADELAEIERHLPIRCVARETWLMVEDDEHRWRNHRRFALDGSAPARASIRPWRGAAARGAAGVGRAGCRRAHPGTGSGGDGMASADAERWDPDQYERFRAERAKPFWDLAGLVEPCPGGRVVDLGCGTGELTSELHRLLRAAE